jgi:hypothetical protein
MSMFVSRGVPLAACRKAFVVPLHSLVSYVASSKILAFARILVYCKYRVG